MSALLAFVLVCARVAEGLRAGPSAEYVVYPKLLEARGLNGVKLLHINEKLTLRLEKSSVLAENFVVSSLNGDKQVDNIVNGKEVEKNIYHDKSQMAVVSVTEKDGFVEVRGSLGHTLRIAPLPLMGRSEDGHMAHRVFEIEDPAEFKTDYIEPTERKILAMPRIRTQVQIPDEFFVEVSFIFDEYHSKNFPDEESLLEYAALSVQMVNLRYEATSRPKITFVLVNVMTLTEGDSFTDTIEAADNLRPDRNKRYMLSRNTINNLGNAIKTKRFKTKADLTVLITSLDLADYVNGELSNSVLGIAYLGGVCHVRMSVGQSEDVPHTHSMVPILTHELGHALGMVHDGETARYSTPGNKDRVCDPKDGFTMAPVAHGQRQGQWSPCSLDQVRGFVSTLRKRCFDLLSPVQHRINMTELPGAKLTKQRLCELTYPGFSDMSTEYESKKAKECSVMCCPTELNGQCLYAGFTDGMECASGHHCVKHQCVKKERRPRPASPTTQSKRRKTART
ncbi:A disintegrin and metalloproteinase with thrombospondin motifs 7-like [Ixodes scapularis]|uniref:A disintegrin and metalloproteinase with thrombospondin motifs 7-like n=1 Tax=Ixodes scapularis TaxID=6945 RepID=UPI001C3801FB|nr:A disintegrin and metalloproteinase with thrombospondin motifs 7-like [Ixodes scapularis]